MGKFIVRFGTFAGGSSIVMITGKRLFGFNLPPPLAAWLNQPSAVNAITDFDLGPDGHYALTYRTQSGSQKQLRSPGLEEWLGLPGFSKDVCVNFTWGTQGGQPRGLIATWEEVGMDGKGTGRSVWTTRDLPESLTGFMGEHGLGWDNNVHEMELGCDGAWMLLTGTVSGYDVNETVKGFIMKGGGVVNSGFALNKMAPDQCYLEIPLAHLHISPTWLSTLGPAINDPAVNTLVRGYYDEKRHCVVLPGGILASQTGGGGGAGGGYLTGDNFSTGLDIVSNTMVVVGNVTGGAASGCCVIL